MSAKDHPSIELSIDAIVSKAKKELLSSESGLFAKFIRLYYSQTRLEDFEDTAIENLYGGVKSHWDIMQQRRGKEFKIRVFNPELKKQGWQSKHTVIEVATVDMPFLVDSMRMVLNRLGLTIHLMVHMGGMKIARDSKGKIVDVFAYDSKGKEAKIESPIYMEIDRQTDPKVLSGIQADIKRVLHDVLLAVEDWGSMQQRLRETIEIISSGDMPQGAAEVNESIAFLEWMFEDHFTFLGARDYERVGNGDDIAMRLIPGSGLGVLRDESRSKVIRKYSELPRSARKIALSKDQILIISKTNTRSTIHRTTYTDYIGIKLFKAGKLIKERRFIGLYTSSAYNMHPKAIPVLRKKVASIFVRSGLPLKSHAGKDLMHILSTFPRDDLFQASTDELYRISMGILHLQERRKIRLFVRKDAYGRYVSCLVYIPRDNFSTDVLNRMMKILKKTFHGTEVSFNTLFSASILARIHFVVRVDPKKKLKYNFDELEKKLAEVGKSWYDGFRDGILESFGEERGNQLYEKYRHAFPAGYREAFSPRNAVYDVEYIDSLSSINVLGMSFYRPVGAARDVIKFKLFRQDQTVPLSDALPLLENMGLRVIGENPYQLTFEDGSRVCINDFSMTYAIDPTFEVEEVKTIFQEAFNKIWLYDAENDGFNRLVLEAQLDWREISMLRAYTKYLRQTGFTYSPQYIAETLVNNAGIAHLLVDLFKYYFDPKIAKESQESIARVEDLIAKKLDDVAILDEDRILRRCLDVIHATLRTNYFQVDSEGKPKSYLSFKFDSSKVPDLPLPLPKYEIYVYSPRFEGVHLRASKVARGGIRWSDRREDFRTEVLRLMKAQSVKNAVIVPAGAKGGFVPKCLPADASREEVLEEGIACYRGYIQGLLDLTDNLKGKRVVPPINTVCYDDHDPYLVVAADKGTATFSDIANSIAIERKYWLGDAFASGGSTGYDHKKMGITARGAWVSAERHFQELGINIDETEVTVVGIGDMSGDVFGNGVLLSKHLKLVAAFNHLHIFLDPDPDPAVSFQERDRLFNLPRSSWTDYDRKLISKGGGVYRRAAKSINITPEVKKLLHISKDSLVPNELIRAILKAPVDLIWNGGIGTYVKASKESNHDVGDRTNDVLRINGSELRARVISEGGNLGLTQLARSEYELNGGKINTDFIDNSAGVDCSDHEVNIKILLNDVVSSGELTEKQRNALLARMTDEVANLVLQDNYHQNQAISLASYLAPSNVTLYMRYIKHQEQEGRIDRALEFLPDDKTLMERKSAGLGLTRPEISILFAYSKIILEDKIRSSDLPEDPYVSQYVKNAFPTPLRKRYSDLLSKHRLSREIISTQLSNRIVSSMGLKFIYQLHDETGATTSAIVRAYIVAYKVFHMEDLYADIESLDYKVDTIIQHQMTDDVVRLIRRATRWFLRNRRENMDIEKTIDHFSEHVLGLFRRLPKLILGDDKGRLDEHKDGLIAANVNPDIALKVASTLPMYHAINIIEAASIENADVYHVAKIYFILVDRLDLLWFRDQINKFPAESRWTILAKAAYKGDLDLIQRQLTIGVLHLDVKSKSITTRINAWFNQYKALIARWESVLVDIRGTQVKDFEIFSVAIRGLSELAQANMDVKNKKDQVGNNLGPKHRREN